MLSWDLETCINYITKKKEQFENRAKWNPLKFDNKIKLINQKAKYLQPLWPHTQQMYHNVTLTPDETRNYTNQDFLMYVLKRSLYSLNFLK